jgi:selenocysteine lyase/cysteine desulfurase
LEDVGLARVQAELGARVDHLIGLVDRLGLELLSPRSPGQRAGILTFRAAGADHGELSRALVAKRVLCAARGGGIRFSPHFYTPFDALDRAMDRVRTLLAR